MKCLRASGEAAKGALKAQQTPIPSITYHLDMSKFVGATTCPYCSKNFRNAGPFDKHLRVSHPKLAVEFYNNRISRREGCNAPERGPENGIGSEPKVYDVPFEVSGSPDHDNDDEVEEEEEEEEEEDRHHRSDEESESESEKPNNDSEPDDSQPTRCELYESSGRSYGCVEGEEERIRGLLQNPWHPFRNASEFKLARFFVEANIPWGHIDSFMKASLAPPEVHFTSAYTFRALLNNMDNGLGPESWWHGDVIFSGTKVPFYFRDPVDCVKYLIRQKAYQSDLVYSPERLYEGDERQYGELHTADWWWDTQVTDPETLYF